MYLLITFGLALLIPATASHAQEIKQERTVRSFSSLDKEGSNQCPSVEVWERGTKETKQQVRTLLSEYLTDSQTRPTSIPTTIHTHLHTKSQTTEQSTASPTTGQITEESMSTTAAPLYTCNGTPGWRQVVFINMTDTSYNCPPGLSLTSYSKRTCGRAHTGKDCSSTTFGVGGSEYSQVCGRIRGYQRGSIDAFYGYFQFSQTIEGWYVDGVSLTHGPVGGRNHIWTFAAGYSDLDDLRYPFHQCPCDTSDSRIQAPLFIGNDYFCESGTDIVWISPYWHGRFFPDDPLWDGQGCSSTSTCCQLNNPPWFTKNLPSPTTDDIEFRMCFEGSYQDDDIAIELIELYIQ